MKLKVFFLFIFTTMIVNGLKSQNADLYLVKLKSGLIIKCEVLKIVPDSFVKIRQFNFESTIKMSEVQMIEFSETSALFVNKFKEENKSQNRRANLKNIPDSGWNFGLSIGFSLGSAYYGITSNFVGRANLLRTNKKNDRFMYGPYFAIEPYTLYETAVMTPGVEGRYHFKKNVPKTFFTYSYTGYSLSLTEPNPLTNGGAAFGIGLGKSGRTRAGNIFSMMFGYKHQSLTGQIYLNTRNGWEFTKAFYRLNRFEARVEWRF
jgi:hypothetical protein